VGVCLISPKEKSGSFCGRISLALRGKEIAAGYIIRRKRMGLLRVSAALLVGIKEGMRGG